MSTAMIALEPTRASVESAATAAARTEALPHMPQLDAVRTIAILGVMACHFFANPVAAQGSQGVTLFFVLSGFLITGILLKCRQYVERDGQSRLFTLRQFYMRRFLRIFPLYYAVLAVLWALHNNDVRADFGWHLAYLTNVRIAINAAHNQYPLWSIGHFWSLAVEEQFYLVWPWVVLFLSRRNLVRTVVLLVLAGPAFRFIALALHVHAHVIDRLPFYYLDALGMGALLAVASDPAFGLHRWIARTRPFALAAGVALVALSMWLGAEKRHFTFRITIYYFGYCLVFGWLVSRAAVGFSGMAGRVMSWKPILWIGTISYGIYVFHYILGTYSIKRPLPPMHPLLRGLLLGTASIGLAAISFYIYERPINRLRRFFPYRVKPAAARTNSVATAAALKESPQLVR
jgi:peptidoglycan/LPS O-acetylase OafA/YrhL